MRQCLFALATLVVVATNGRASRTALELRPHLRHIQQHVSAQSALGRPRLRNLAGAINEGPQRACSNGLEVAIALADPSVSNLLLTSDVDMLEADWSGLRPPVLVARNVTVVGANRDRSTWFTLNLNFIKDKVILGSGVHLTFSNLALYRYREDPHFMAPGIDLVKAGNVPSDPPGPIWPAIAGISVAFIQRTCVPLAEQKKSSDTIPRPNAYPGTQATQVDVPQTGCTNSTTAGPTQRCWPMMGTYDDIVATSYNLDNVSRPYRAGYLIFIRQSDYICETLMTEQCAAQYQPVGCFWHMFPKTSGGGGGGGAAAGPNSAPSVGPGSSSSSSSSASPPPAAAGGGASAVAGGTAAVGAAGGSAAGGGRGVDDGAFPLAYVLGGTLGGLALIGSLLGLALAVHYSRRRRGHRPGCANGGAAAGNLNSDKGFTRDWRAGERGAEVGGGGPTEQDAAGGPPAADGSGCPRAPPAVTIALSGGARNDCRAHAAADCCQHTGDGGSLPPCPSGGCKSTVNVDGSPEGLLPQLPVTSLTPLQPGINLDICLGGGELQLSGVTLGKGAFGRVVRGTYRGVPVAVKVIDHGLGPSPHVAAKAAAPAAAGASMHQPAVDSGGGAPGGAGGGPSVHTVTSRLGSWDGAALAAMYDTVVAASDDEDAEHDVHVVRLAAAAATAAACAAVGAAPKSAASASTAATAAAERGDELPPATRSYAGFMTAASMLTTALPGDQHEHQHRHQQPPWGDCGGATRGDAAAAAAIAVPSGGAATDAIPPGGCRREAALSSVAVAASGARGRQSAAAVPAAAAAAAATSIPTIGSRGTNTTSDAATSSIPALTTGPYSGPSVGTPSGSQHPGSGSDSGGAPAALQSAAAPADAAAAPASVVGAPQQEQQPPQALGDTDGGVTSSLSATLKQEVEVLARCHHPNIVRLLAACLRPPRLCLVMELMETSLDKMLYGGGVQQRLLPLDRVLYIAGQIACGLAYLHPTIVHRDLKPGNVLISQPQSPHPVVKLADFGLSRLRDTVLITQHPEVGTAPYIAPEAFDVDNFRITDRVDVYALGVMLWEMLAGRRPWAKQHMVMIALAVSMHGQRPPLAQLSVERCPPKLRSLILSCWEQDPARRPAAADVVKTLSLVQQQMQHHLRQADQGSGVRRRRTPPEAAATAAAAAASRALKQAAAVEADTHDAAVVRTGDDTSGTHQPSTWATCVPLAS